MHYLLSSDSWDGGAREERLADLEETIEAADVPIPADAAKVEIGTVITGDGMESPGNCAEFCVTTHHFTVDASGNIRELSDAGSVTGCMDQIMDGTVPNQYAPGGTAARAGGQPVAPRPTRRSATPSTAEPSALTGRFNHNTGKIGAVRWSGLRVHPPAYDTEFN